jgi:hypothetical protein
MSDSIWIVVNAGGNRREKKEADKCNAKACQSLTERRIKDGRDILSKRRFKKAQELKVGARIVMHQGGGKRWRKKGYAAGMLVAAGRIERTARQLQDRYHQGPLWELTKRYFPNSNLEGIICYELCRAKQPLPTEEILGRVVRRGENYIEVKQTDLGYDKLNWWWN